MRKEKVSAEFKAKVALDALMGEETTSRLAQKHGVHPTTITRWKALAQRGMADVFRARHEETSATRKESQEVLDAGQSRIEGIKDFAGNSACHVHPDLVFDEQEHGGGIFRHDRDITIRQGKKPEARDIDELAALGRLAAGAVHEMNNSLGIVLCHAQLLLRDVPANDPIARDVAVIELHARNCARIAVDLLQRARGRKCMLEGQE